LSKLFLSFPENILHREFPHPFKQAKNTTLRKVPIFIEKNIKRILYKVNKII
jgi:hypothetical protein